MVTHLDTSIRNIIRSKMTRTLVPQKLQKVETKVSTLLDSVSCVLISYDLWMSNTTQDFFNDGAFHTLSCQVAWSHWYVYHNIHILLESCIDCKFSYKPVQFGEKLFVIMRDVGTNLARCKEILDSNFENTGFFDLGKPMFVMERLAYVLVNAWRAGVMDVKSDHGKVYTEVFRKNMKWCIT